MYDFEAIINLRDNFSAQMNKIVESTEKMTNSAGKAAAGAATLGATLKGKLVSGLAVTREAFGALGLASAGYLKGAISNAAAAQDRLVDLQQTIKSTGGAAGFTADQVVDLSRKLANQTTFSAGEIQKGQKMLLTFTKVQGQVFTDASMAMLNMAQKYGNLPANQAIQLGKALNDPIQGMTALRRVGVTLDDTQKKQIKNFMAMGQTAKAQQVILAELNKEFGGQAVAAASTYNGMMKQLQNVMGGIKTQIGQAVLPYVQKFVGLLLTLAKTVSGLPKPFLDTVGKVMGLVAIFGSLVGGMTVFHKVVGFLFPQLGSLGSYFTKLIGPMGLVLLAITALTLAYKTNFGGFATWLNDKITKIVTLFKAFKDALSGKEFDLGKVFGKNTEKVATVIRGITDAIKVFISILKGDFSNAQNILNKWGSGSDGKMAKVVTIFKEAALFINRAIVTISQAATVYLPKVRAAIEWVFGKTIKPIFDGFVTVLKTVVSWVVQNLPLIIKTIQKIIEFITPAIKMVIGIISGLLPIIITIVGGVINTIVAIIERVVNIVLDVVKFVMQIINGDWAGAWKTALDIVKNIFGLIGDVFKNMAKTIGTILGDLIKSALQWGKDFIDGLINGIKSGIGKIGDAVKGIGDKIKSFLHFSRPDVGPLADYESWMPDFIKGMAKGIKDNAGLLQNAIQGTALGMKASVSVNSPKQTLLSTGGGGGNTTKNEKHIIFQIAKLADTVKLDSEQDIDETARKLAEKLLSYSFNTP